MLLQTVTSLRVEPPQIKLSHRKYQLCHFWSLRQRSVMVFSKFKTRELLSRSAYWKLETGNISLIIDLFHCIYVIYFFTKKRLAAQLSYRNNFGRQIIYLSKILIFLIFWLNAVSRTWQRSQRDSGNLVLRHSLTY